MSNKVFLIVGPSGVGKNTLLDGLLVKVPNAQSAISVTTRSPRPGETHGVNYFYVTKLEFEAHIKEQDLLQWVEYAGNYYGLLKSEIDNKLTKGHVFCVVEPEGVKQLKTLYPCARSIYLYADRSTVKQRMVDRGDDPDSVASRMVTYDHFSSYLDQANYVINTTSPDNDLEEALEIIQEEDEE